MLLTLICGGNFALLALLSFLLDLLLGDPSWMPHPVVWMGEAITWAEPRLRSLFPADPDGERRAGRLLAAGLPLLTFLLTAGILRFLRRIFPPAAFLLALIWGWQSLALRDLRKESTAVYCCLRQRSLQDARAAVSRIVGRDTENLDREGVIRAAVETVAENFSDGVIAPMFYLLLGGAPLALCYKAVNTMDSMVGYRNERYLYFGRAAARLDDVANLIPARLSALLLIAAAFLCGEDAGNAARIWKRDRRKHASPNAAQTEAAMAGALGIRLAGPASYFGTRYDKPYIGDAVREIQAEDILRANRMISCGSVLGLLLLSALHLLLYGCFSV